MAWGHSNAIGSLALPIAMIIVDYPEGATLTISSQNGGLYTRRESEPVKEDTSRRTYFIKTMDTYTLTINQVVDGVPREVSKDVVIDSIAKSVFVNMSFRFYIYQNAELQNVTVDINGVTYYLRFRSASQGYGTGATNAYGCTATVVTTSTETDPAPYLSIRRASNAGANRGGTTYRAYLTDLASTETIRNDMKSLISEYEYLYVKCRRILYADTNHYVTVGTFDPSISGNYSAAKFRDKVTKRYGSGSYTDSKPVMLKIPITELTTETANAVINIAFVCSQSSSSGINIWDMYLSNTDNDVDDPDIEIVTP